MSTILTILFFIQIILFGYLFLSLLDKDHKFKLLSRLAFSWGVGIILITWQLFLALLIFRLNMNSWLVVVGWGEIIALAFLNFKYHRTWRPQLPNKIKFNWSVIVLIIFIALQVIWSTTNALSRPTATFDSLAFWTIKAKTLFYHNQINFDASATDYLGWNDKINYPWTASLAQYYLAFNLGQFNESVNNLIFVGFFVAILLLIVDFFWSRNELFLGLWLTALLASAPLFFFHSYSPYVDLPLSFYLLAGFIFFVNWLKNKNSWWLMWLGLFFGSALIMKNKASLFVVVVSLLIILSQWSGWKNFKQQVMSLTKFAWSVIIVAGPWYYFFFANHLSLREMTEGVGWHPEIFQKFYEALAISNSWNIWWFIFLLIIILKFKVLIKNKNLIWTSLLWLLPLLGFIGWYLLTEEYKFAVDQTNLCRSILLFLPTSVVIMGLLLKRGVKSQESRIKI